MRLIKEPLVHFILIGFFLFGLYRFTNHKSPPGLIVTSQKAEELSTQFSRDWKLKPTAEELEILIDEYIREELAFREGMVMGLDQNDPVIRQRIRQKFEFLAEEQAAQLRPSDEELELFLQEHAELFQEEGVLPELSEIRNMVIFEWENVQRLKLLEKQYAELYEKYDVVIDRRAE